MGAPSSEREPLTEEQQLRRRQAMPEVMPAAPFMGWMGLVFDKYEPDDVVVRLPFREDLTNDGVVYHGGVIASMLDTAGAAAAWSNHDFDKGVRGVHGEHERAVRRGGQAVRPVVPRPDRQARTRAHLHRDHGQRRRRATWWPMRLQTYRIV